MEILGIDVGFGFTKATNGKDFIIFKSILGEAAEIQFRTSFGNNSFVKNMHVTIEDKPYFIGDFAEQQSSVRDYTLEQERLIADFVKILALTAAGSLSDKYVPLNVVSGLPVGYLKNYYQRFIQILKGHHTVVFHQPDGSAVTRKIHINKVRMMPQPLGSLFNLVMNDSGKITNLELAKKKIGVVDIGFRTTDITILDQLHFMERGSATIDTGIAKCFGAVSQKLREETGVNIELYRLYKAMEQGSIKIRGKSFDIASLKEQAYTHAAKTIASDIERLWAEDWDIDSVILTGGGGKELAPFLKPLVAGDFLPMGNGADPRLYNAQGFLKYGRYEWRDAAADTPPPLPEESAPAK